MVTLWPIAFTLLAGSVPLPDLLAEERAGLVEFYQATGGDAWKDRGQWLTAAPPCDWRGVWCDFRMTPDLRQFAVVVGLSLDDNHLAGTLPARLLGVLPHLRSLSVTENDLRGAVPEDVLARWDAHEFEFEGSGNAFSNLFSRVSLVAESSALCALDSDVNYSLEVSAAGTARFESIRCKPGTERETVCLVREGRVRGIERLARALRALSFQELRAEYDYPVTGVTHGTYVTTSAWFGDGKQWSLKTYSRQGPIRAWASQAVFFSLLSEATWEREYTRESCASVR